MAHVVQNAIVPSPQLDARSPAEVGRDFAALLASGVRLAPSGEARRDPARLLARHRPKYSFRLFDTRFFLARVVQNPYARFFVAYVVQGRRAYPRIFYKDVSLVWRAASHLGRQGGEVWIGKGDTVSLCLGDEEYEFSNEATTDLPLEIQALIEELNHLPGKVRSDHRAFDLVLRAAPAGRIAPFAEFTAARRRAQANPRNLVNRGRPVARFRRANDPTSLRFAAGYGPDFARGVYERTSVTSRLYGGLVQRFRILSENRRIQYLFYAAPRHAWIQPPQATTTELSSFGVRTIDVVHDENLCVPGYEYHFLEDGELYSQIPQGFAGPWHPDDVNRADASAWIEQMPVIREFRRVVLGKAAA
jgi:hypothetical protein